MPSRCPWLSTNARPSAASRRGAGSHQGDAPRPETPGLADEVLDRPRGPRHGIGVQDAGRSQILTQPGHHRPPHDRERSPVHQVGHQEPHGVGAHIEGGATMATPDESPTRRVVAPEVSESSQEALPRRSVRLGERGHHRPAHRPRAAPPRTRGGTWPGRLRRARRCRPRTRPRHRRAPTRRAGQSRRRARYHSSSQARAAPRAASSSAARRSSATPPRASQAPARTAADGQVR